MNSRYGNQQQVRDNVAAELTEAVYPIVLQQGVRTQWPELEVNLWKALSEALSTSNAKLSAN